MVGFLGAAAEEEGPPIELAPGGGQELLPACIEDHAGLEGPALEMDPATVENPVVLAVPASTSHDLFLMRDLWDGG